MVSLGVVRVVADAEVVDPPLEHLGRQLVLVDEGVDLVALLQRVVIAPVLPGNPQLLLEELGI